MSADDKKHYSEYTDVELQEMEKLARDVHDTTIKLAVMIRKVSGYHDAHVAFTHATSFHLLQVMQGCVSAMCSSTIALANQIKAMRDNNGNI